MDLTNNDAIYQPFEFCDGRFHCRAAIYKQDRSSVTMIVLPAIGIQAKAYSQLVTVLLSNRFNVVLADMPGNGWSTPKPDRHRDYGYRELVEEFIPELVGIAKKTCPGTNYYLLGHSLGGHLATLYANSKSYDRIPIIGVACGNICYRHWDGLEKFKTPFASMVFYLLTVAYGYLPGYKVGFGRHEAKTMMRDWAKVAWTGRYDHIDIDWADHCQLAGDESLYIGIQGDGYAPERSLKALADLVNNETNIRFLPPPNRSNAHSGWIKDPRQVVDVIRNWIMKSEAIDEI